MKPLEPIRVELTGDDTAAAEGVTAKTSAGPALALCRKLIDAGFGARRQLHCYRGVTLCLTLTSIGWGARYTVAEGTTGRPFLRRYRPLDPVVVAAPVRRNDVAAISSPRRAPEVKISKEHVFGDWLREVFPPRRNDNSHSRHNNVAARHLTAIGNGIT